MLVKLKPDNNLKIYYLSNDREYMAELIHKSKMTWYKIKCDDGKFREFSESNFISVEEMRNNKLNNLGIE